MKIVRDEFGILIMVAVLGGIALVAGLVISESCTLSGDLAMMAVGVVLMVMGAGAMLSTLLFVDLVDAGMPAEDGGEPDEA